MAEHDYIVVGAGSAGCVLANRLSEDPAISVLLVEAGGKDRSPNIKIPAAFANQFKTKLDWEYYIEPEPHVDGPLLYIPRGRSLGGSSSMNAMLYVRGRPLDYDLWEAGGAEGWGLAGRAALLHALRAKVPRSLGAPRRRGRAGGERVALAAPAGQAPAGGQRGRGDSLRARLQRARAGRLLDVPGQPAQRQALERRRRLPATGSGPAEPRRGQRASGARRAGRRRTRDRHPRPRRLRARADDPRGAR